MPVPKTGALPLGYTPIIQKIIIFAILYKDINLKLV
tara:strand:- start:418 stop:525 length:108 start_codon:yes stop_codon:yes gene_type:complete